MKQVGNAGMNCHTTSFLVIYLRQNLKTEEPQRERERMEAKYQALPPLKRFRLLQRQQEEEDVDHAAEEDYKENVPISLKLPAKKRNESRSSLLHLLDGPTPRLTAATAPAVTTTYCLPTKKRIRALHPDYFSSFSGKPLLPLDLNVEYKPPFDDDEDKKTPFAIGANQREIAQIHEISNLKENPFGDSSNQSIEADKEGNEEKKIPFVCSADAQSTEIAEQDEKGGDEGREEQEEKAGAGAGAEDDGILCAICQSTDGDPADPIVLCDGCDLMVHSTCYGNPLAKGIPEDDWFCSRCLISRSQEQRMPISCCLCPSKNGALKPTKNESWAHIICALFVPEVFFEDPDGREGIDCSMVPKSRWGGKCYMCQNRKGCVVECSESKCSLAFHVTCALDGDLCIEYREGKKKKETIVAGFCKSHTELWRKQQKTGKFKIVAREKWEK